MSASFKVCSLLKKNINCSKFWCFTRTQIRPPRTLFPVNQNKFKLGDTGEYRTWKDIQEELKDKDEEPPANIGVEWNKPKPDLNLIRKKYKENRESEELEQQARFKTLKVPLPVVAEDCLSDNGPSFTASLINHYGIYEDLFNGAYFMPVVPLRIFFNFNKSHVTPIYHGNIVPASYAKFKPIVEFNADEDSLWTLLLTNPDGHLVDNESEYVHWMIGNIRGDDISSGETLCEYLRPFPPKGTGYHRFVFLLFKQDKVLDYQDEKLTENGIILKDRTFQTVEFLRKYQDVLTPMGCSFFQSTWDRSVRHVYHNILNMREPNFAYAHPLWFRAVQVKYPEGEPFNRYFDRYRDTKDINEEVLRIKLDQMSPFTGYKEQLKYPLVHNYDKATWLRQKEELMHRRLEQFKDLPR